MSVHKVIHLKILLTIFIFLGTGCSSYSTSLMSGYYHTVKDINTPIPIIFRAFEYSVPSGKLRGKSRNGREVVSSYFPCKGVAYEDATKMKRRCYVQMAIRGSYRPYDVRIQVVEQKRSGRTKYSISGYDKGRTSRVVKRFKKFLAARPDKDDFIDDFRVY